jgi:hypothetical protein
MKLLLNFLKKLLCTHDWRITSSGDMKFLLQCRKCGEYKLLK